MRVRIDVERLRIEIEKQFGNVKTSGLKKLEDASRDEENRVTITGRTVRNLLGGGGWNNGTVERLCEVLGIHPAQILVLDVERNGHTHASPQLATRAARGTNAA